MTIAIVPLAEPENSWAVMPSIKSAMEAGEPTALITPLLPVTAEHRLLWCFGCSKTTLQTRKVHKDGSAVYRCSCGAELIHLICVRKP